MQTVNEETTNIELAEYEVPIIARGEIIDDYPLTLTNSKNAELDSYRFSSPLNSLFFLLSLISLVII